MFPQENCNTAALDIFVFLPLLTRAALHVQLVEEPGAAGGEGRKKASCGFNRFESASS